MLNDDDDDDVNKEDRERLDTIVSSITPGSDSHPKDSHDMIVEEEEKQLETCTMKESLPTSKATFKKHPRYVLASCLIVVITAILARCGIGQIQHHEHSIQSHIPSGSRPG